MASLEIISRWLSAPTTAQTVFSLLVAAFILRAAAAVVMAIFFRAHRTAFSLWSKLGETFARTGRAPCSDEDLDVLADDVAPPPLPAPIVAPVALPADVSLAAGRAQTPADGAGRAPLAGGGPLQARNSESGEDKENAGGDLMHGFLVGKHTIVGGASVGEIGERTPLSPCGDRSPAPNVPVVGAGGDQSARVDDREGTIKHLGGAGAALPPPISSTHSPYTLNRKP